MPEVAHGPATSADQAVARKPQATGGGHAVAAAPVSGGVVALMGAAQLLGLQRLVGNHAVAATMTVSRQNAPQPATDPKFDATTFISAGPRFTLTYVPVGPMPKAKGTATVTLRVHIDFQNFTRADMRTEPFRSHRFTPSQLADFTWKPAEKEAFGRDFQQSVQAGWSGKHELATKEPDFAEHRAAVQVKVELVEAGKAHNTMTAKKIPKGKPGDKPLPRLRSNVAGNKSTLDQRDPTEPNPSKVRNKPVVDQVTGFAHDSAAITPEVRERAFQVATRIKKANLTFGPQTDGAGKKHDLQLWTIGRATSPGSAVHNDALGQQRADAVLAALLSELGPVSTGLSMTAGELNATEEEQFRRVDVQVTDRGADAEQDVSQDTAAHEAGHMFGLDDEYVEENAPAGVEKKFEGDKPEHYGDVKAELGDEAADETITKDSDSIMSRGSNVKRGHYMPFLKAIETATSKQWTVA